MGRRVNGEIKNISDILKVALGEPALPDSQQIIYGREKLGNCQMPEVNHSECWLWSLQDTSSWLK